MPPRGPREAYCSICKQAQAAGGFSEIIVKLTSVRKIEHNYNLPDKFKKKLEAYPEVFQPAGENNAWKYLNSFTNKRGSNYQKHISKPTESRKSCSRLSPYLAWGNLSIKQVFQFVGTHPNGVSNDRAFSAMLTRLHWHCHFIQKFEVECSYEQTCINRGYELLEPIRLEPRAEMVTGIL